ncbi:DNA polymerase III subunit beta family protein [Kitasatospora sp. NPDC004240]
MTVTTAALPRFVTQLAPHISTDTTLPSIGGIYLEADGTHLLAAATDRYTFAVTRTEATEPQPWRAVIARADLTALRALFPARRRPADLHLTHSRGCTRTPDGLLTIGDGTRSLTLNANASLARKFPKWRPLFAAALAAEPHQDTETHYNADFLARWAKAAEHWQPLTTWSAGPGKPLLVAAGPDFLGLQMPVRSGDHRPETPVRDRQDRTALRAVWADTLPTARRLKAA